MSVEQLSCLFCCRPIPGNYKEFFKLGNRTEALPSLFDKLCSSNVISQLNWDLVKDPFPFCKSCRFRIRKLYDLTESLKEIELHIAHKVKILRSIVVRPNPWDNEPEFDWRCELVRNLMTRQDEISSFPAAEVQQSADEDDGTGSVGACSMSSSRGSLKLAKTEVLTPEIYVASDIFESFEGEESGEPPDIPENMSQLSNEPLLEPEESTDQADPNPLPNVSFPASSNDQVLSTDDLLSYMFSQQNVPVETNLPQDEDQASQVFLFGRFEYLKTAKGYECCTCKSQSLAPFCLAVWTEEKGVRLHISTHHARTDRLSKCPYCHLKVQVLFEHRKNCSKIPTLQPIVTAKQSKKNKSQSKGENSAPSGKGPGILMVNQYETYRGFQYRMTETGLKCSTCYMKNSKQFDQVRWQNGKAMRRHIREYHEFGLSKENKKKPKAENKNTITEEKKKKSKAIKNLSCEEARVPGLIIEALAQLNDRGGSSRKAIKNFIAANHPDIDMSKAGKIIKHGLPRYVLSGILVEPRDHVFKLAPSTASA